MTSVINRVKELFANANGSRLPSGTVTYRGRDLVERIELAKDSHAWKDHRLVAVDGRLVEQIEGRWLQIGEVGFEPKGLNGQPSVYIWAEDWLEGTYCISLETPVTLIREAA